MKSHKIFLLFSLIFLPTCHSSAVMTGQFTENPTPPKIQERQAKPEQVLKEVGQIWTNTAGNVLKGVQHFVVGLLSGINDVGLLGQGIEPIVTSTVDPEEETTTTHEDDEDKGATTIKIGDNWSLPTFHPTTTQPIENELQTVKKILFRTSTPPPPPPRSKPPFFEQTGLQSDVNIPPKNSPSLPAEAYLPLIHSQYPQYQLVAVRLPPNFVENKQQIQSTSTPPTKIQLNDLKTQIVPKFPEHASNEQPVLKLVESNHNIPSINNQNNYLNLPPTFRTNQPLLDYTRTPPPKYTVRRRLVTTQLPPKPEGKVNYFNFEVTLGPVVRPPGHRQQPPFGGYEFKQPPPPPPPPLQPAQEKDEGFHHGQGFGEIVRKPPPFLELVPGAGPASSSGGDGGSRPFGPGQVEETEGPEEIVQQATTTTTTEGGDEVVTEDGETGEANVDQDGRRLLFNNN